MFWNSSRRLKWCIATRTDVSNFTTQCILTLHNHRVTCCITSSCFVSKTIRCTWCLAMVARLKEVLMDMTLNLVHHLQIRWFTCLSAHDVEFLWMGLVLFLWLPLVGRKKLFPINSVNISEQMWSTSSRSRTKITSSQFCHNNTVVWMLEWKRFTSIRGRFSGSAVTARRCLTIHTQEYHGSCTALHVLGY